MGISGAIVVIIISISPPVGMIGEYSADNKPTDEGGGTSSSPAFMSMTATSMYFYNVAIVN